MMKRPPLPLDNLPSEADLSTYFKETIVLERDLSHKVLRSTDFRGAKKLSLYGVKYANFNSPNFSGCDVHNSTFTNCQFYKLQSEETDWSKASFSSVRLHEPNCLNANFSASKWKEVAIQTGCMGGCDFRKSALNDVSFIKMNLTGTSFCGATFEKTLFRQCNLSKVSFKGCDISNIQFLYCRLNQTHFTVEQYRLPNVQKGLISSASTIAELVNATEQINAFNSKKVLMTHRRLIRKTLFALVKNRNPQSISATDRNSAIRLLRQLYPIRSKTPWGSVAGTQKNYVKELENLIDRSEPTVLQLP